MACGCSLAMTMWSARPRSWSSTTSLEGPSVRRSTIDVEFREHWGGIFAAHPWLAGPSDSYLGFRQRGGGASGEHSHGINLWQHLCHVVGGGRVEEVDARLDFGKDGTSDFDSLCAMNLRSENGIVGRRIQDVDTAPQEMGQHPGRAGAHRVVLRCQGRHRHGDPSQGRWRGCGDEHHQDAA